MKSVKKVILSVVALLAGSTGFVFANGYPVFDVSTLLQDIDEQYHQLDSNASEQIFNYDVLSGDDIHTSQYPIFDVSTFLQEVDDNYTHNKQK